MGLYKKTLAAIDGSKFRAQNSKKNAFNRKTLTEKLDRIGKNIKAYLEDMDALDQQEEDQPQFTKEEIQEKLAELKKRQGKYEGLLEYLDTSSETQVLTTDPDARVMQSKDGYHCCYNVQTIVDESHLIVDYAVTNSCTDQARQQLDQEVISVVADRGYESRNNIEDCFLDGIIPNATRALESDIPLKVVAEWLGHSTIRVTGDIYSHALPEKSGTVWVG